MKAVKEKALEKAFVRVINRLIGEKGGYLEQSDFGEEEYRVEELQARIEELQAKMMDLTKTGFDNEEYSALAGEIDLLCERMGGVKGRETERLVRDRLVEELRDYLMAQESDISKFDEGIFRRFVEKVRVRSMVEVEFLFKAGVEVREVLG